MENSVFDPDIQNEHTDSKIVAALERISQAFRVLLWNETRQHSLSPIQVQVLIFLLYHSPDKCKVSYLASEFNMTKPTISDVIKVLTEKGLVSKWVEDADNRSYQIQLTAKGREVAGKTTMFTKELETPIQQLNPVDRQNLLSSLMSIIDHLNKSGVISAQRMCYSCAYYRSNYQGHSHFCGLLQKELASHDIRLDCPEHKAG